MPIQLTDNQKRLLELAAQRILANPNEYHQAHFVCGTRMCIGAHVTGAALDIPTDEVIRRFKLDMIEFPEAAFNALRLDWDEGDEVCNYISCYLFDWSSREARPNWPEPFDTQYVMARTPEERADVAARRIRHLIAEGE